MTTALMRVRLPINMKAQLLAQAKANHRSLNGEIVAVLEAALNITKDKEAEI